MAIFNLTDITFKKEERGPLQKLESSAYGNYSFRKYPIDLGNSHDKGHYMTIFINEQIRTQYFNGGTFPDDDIQNSPSALNQINTLSSLRGPNVIQAAGTLAGEIRDAARGSDVIDKAINFVSDIFGGVSGSLGNVLSQSNTVKNYSEILRVAAANGLKDINNGITALQSGKLRTIRRTKTAIALYMPDTLNFTYNQSYSDLATFDQLGMLGTAAAAGVSLVDSKTSPGQLNLSSFLLQTLKQQSGVAGTIGQVGLAALGFASNPGLELLYTSPSFRSFRFDFMFYPRDEVESFEVKTIIDTLKFHQAPEITTGTGQRFLVPPSEFDIKFYYNGTENPNIPKISTCVLEQIDVDYAPNGFSAYEVPGENIPSPGKTGSPVAIRLSLQFKETQIITKEFYSQDGLNPMFESDGQFGRYGT
jgi:hypothetical protein